MDALIWADLILIVHALIALFIGLGLAMILLGWWRHWQWPRRRWFRCLHLGAIVWVAFESWFGMTCPLTEWERWLRVAAGQTPHKEGFIVHWVSELLFYSAPLWLFGVIYTLALVVTLLAWWRYPPAPSIVNH